MLNMRKGQVSMSPEPVTTKCKRCYGQMQIMQAHLDKVMTNIKTLSVKTHFECWIPVCECGDQNIAHFGKQIQLFPLCHFYQQGKFTAISFCAKLHKCTIYLTENSVLTARSIWGYLVIPSLERGHEYLNKKRRNYFRMSA